jgi:xylulokinase
VLALAQREYQLSVPRPGWSEQDPDDWWRATEAVLGELDAAGATAIGLTGQMHGLVVLGSDDRPLRPAILWNDGRTQAQCEQIEALVGLEHLAELAGSRAEAGFTAPKLRWLAQHEPDVLTRTRSILLPKDYVRLRLCGERATDVTDASGTLWFDVAARRWSQELIEALEVDAGWLPRVEESATPVGRAFGAVPVAAGAGDQAAGALGLGVIEPGGPASVVLGTSGVVLASQQSFAPDRLGRVHAFCHALPDTWHTMGVMLSAAGALRWLRDALGGGADYDVLLAEAATWPPGCEGLLFAPYLAGERTPWSDPAARGAFVGLGLHHDRGALVRAVLEGVAFGLRDGLDLILDTSGPAGAPTAGRVSGGGARSELWLEIVASVLDLPLEMGAVDEGAAYGAALLGGIAGGVFTDARDAVSRCVRATRAVAPRPEWVARYAELRPRFSALYPALRPLQD